MSLSSPSTSQSYKSPPTKDSLSPACQRLVELIAFVHFGRIEDLSVKFGQPDFTKPPLVIRTVKVGGNPSGGDHPHRGRRSRSARENFYLRPAMADLIDQLGKVTLGRVTRIEVAHGAPLFFELAHRPPVVGPR